VASEFVPCVSDPNPSLVAPPRRVFDLSFLAQLSNPVVLWWTIANPAEFWCSIPPISTHDSTPTLSRLDLGFEAQPWNRPQLCLAIVATMWPTLDPAGHWVPRTKPTCLLHTWRPHRHRPFALVLHLHQHQSSCNLHLQYLAKSQSTQCCQEKEKRRDEGVDWMGGREKEDKEREGGVGARGWCEAL
jgi:hypothetical protein